MKSFKDFVNEGGMNKAQYAEVKSKLGRELEKVFKAAQTVYLDVVARNRVLDSPFQDLYYSSPNSIASFKSFGKKLDKIKPDDRNSPVYHAYKSAYDSMADRVAEVDSMKDGVVSATVQREVAKTKQADAQAKTKDEQNTLVTELEKYRTEYVMHAGKMADERYDAITKPLHANGYDLDKVAPAPTMKMGQSEYRAASAYRALLSRLTGSTGRPSEIHKATYRKEQQSIADASFESWVMKMITKVGAPVVKAHMYGNPWTGSVLKVTTATGEEQSWNTQMIVNFSKYGNMFNQFPSRRK